MAAGSNPTKLNAGRILRHLLVPDWLALRPFPAATLQRIEEAIGRSEARHRGEIRFALEASLPPLALAQSPRERAEQAFALLRVWDTEENCGILLYVETVDHAIEIVADRGIAARVPQAQWEAICGQLASAFRENRHEAGVLAAIDAMGALLEFHFPAGTSNPNELPDRPALL